VNRDAFELPARSLLSPIELHKKPVNKPCRPSRPCLSSGSKDEMTFSPELPLWGETPAYIQQPSLFQRIYMQSSHLSKVCVGRLGQFSELQYDAKLCRKDLGLAMDVESSSLH
jgi:hypothetical protein